MRHQLDQLLRVRETRQRQAERVLLETRRAKESAEQELESAEDALCQQRAARHEQSHRLMTEARQAKLSQKELKRLRGKLAGMRRLELTRMEEVSAASEQLTSCELDLAEARSAYAKSERHRQKIAEQLQYFQCLALRDEERAEEAELEDFPKPVEVNRVA